MQTWKRRRAASKKGASSVPAAAGRAAFSGQVDRPPEIETPKPPAIPFPKGQEPLSSDGRSAGCGRAGRCRPDREDEPRTAGLRRSGIPVRQVGRATGGADPSTARARRARPRRRDGRPGPARGPVGRQNRRPGHRPHHRRRAPSRLRPTAGWSTVARSAGGRSRRATPPTARAEPETAPRPPLRTSSPRPDPETAPPDRLQQPETWRRPTPPKPEHPDGLQSPRRPSARAGDAATRRRSRRREAHSPSAGRRASPARSADRPRK